MPPLVDRFKLTAAGSGSTAAVQVDGNASTFAHLLCATDELSQHCLQSGCHSSLAGVHIGDCYERILSVLALWQIGGAYVPLGPG